MKAPPRNRQARPPVPCRRPNSWRDNIEGILSAIVLVLIIRHFVFEVFKIPTGSMGPTLVGQHERLTCPNCGFPFDVDAGFNQPGEIPPIKTICPNCGRIIPVRKEPLHPPRMLARRLFFNLVNGISAGNRVIVNKFAARFGPPKRWSVVVFIQPDSKENYIKRLIGLPGEKITIQHGDIFADGQLMRKPDDIQESLWQPVLDSRFHPKEEIRPTWEVLAGRCHTQGGGLVMTPGPENRAGVKYAPELHDFIPYTGNRSVTPDYLDGDLKWDLDVVFDEPGILLLHIREDNVYYSAILSFDEAGPPTSLLKGDYTLVETDFRAAPGRRYNVAFSNVDDRLALAINGKRILEADVPVALANLPLETEKAEAWIETRGAVVRFPRVRLLRDIYYTAYSVRDFHVPGDGYFVLGDNTRNSRDSRSWGSYPIENQIGNAVVVWWPLTYLRPIYYE